MVSIAGRVTNFIFKKMPGPSVDEAGYLEERRRNAARKPPRKPANVEIEQITVNGLPAERLTAKGNSRGLALYIHGGGFTTGAASERRYITQYLAGRCGYDCIAINYRLAPENKWPAMPQDCLQAYREVLDMGYPAQDIVFAGESAGGTLVFSLAFLARDSGLPMPKAIAAFSPGTDNASDLLSHTSNIATDYMLRDAVAKGIAEPLFDGEADISDLRDPLLSPVNGDFTGLPPVFLSVSDTEVLYDDSVIMYEKLKTEGHPVELDVQHGVCHAFQVMTYMPEARRSIRKMMDFLDGIGNSNQTSEGGNI